MPLADLNQPMVAEKTVSPPGQAPMAATSLDTSLDEVSAARAEIYALLATLLWHPPEAALLNRVGGAHIVGQGALPEALRALSVAARASTAVTVEREHFALFTGLAGGELLPYASYYLTGFVHERPLAEVRGDLSALGFERAEGLAEPEDHIAFLCEVMATMIRGDFGISDVTVAQFFGRHILPWAGRFFSDLEAADAASFYRPVGQLGQLMVAIETQAFALPV